jgi:hypothetical protein
MEGLGFKLKSDVVKLLFAREEDSKLHFTNPNWNWTNITEPNHFLPRDLLHDY